VGQADDAGGGTLPAGVLQLTTERVGLFKVSADLARCAVLRQPRLGQNGGDPGAG
jgi:hypothetical protein